MATTKSVCDHNKEEHGIAGGKDTATDPISALIVAGFLFCDGLKSADQFLKKFAAQPCPSDCKKTPHPG